MAIGDNGTRLPVKKRDGYKLAQHAPSEKITTSEWESSNWQGCDHNLILGLLVWI